MLGREDFQRLCRKTGGSYHIDLSDIPHEIHQPLLRSLDTYGTGLFISLTISCSRLAHVTPDREVPESIATSIAAVIPDYFSTSAQFAVKLLSVSKILKELRIVSVDTTLRDLVALASAAGRSHRLRVFDLTDLPITDENVEPILSELFSPTMTCVTLRHCALTNDCIPVVVKYATEVRRRFGKSGISEIDLSNNDIDQVEFEKVVSALNRFNIAEEDLREEKLRERLKEENALLEKEIEKLKKIKFEIEHRGALFIIGEGAPALVQQMQIIDQRLSVLEQC
jgi:hypothetical protein